MKFMQFIYRKCDVLDIIIALASLYADNIVSTFIGLILLIAPTSRLIATVKLGVKLAREESES